MKGWMWVILLALLGFLKDLLFADLTSWTVSALAEVLLRFHASRLPRPSADRYLEQWRTDLHDTPENTLKIWNAFSMFWKGPEITEEVAAAERDAAQPNHSSGDVVIALTGVSAEGSVGSLSVTLQAGTLEFSGQPLTVSVPSDGWMTSNRIASSYRSYQAPHHAAHMAITVQPPPALFVSLEETIRTSDSSTKKS